MKIRFSSRVAEPGSANAVARALAARRGAGLPVLNLAESNPTRVGLGPSREAILTALGDEGNLRYDPDPRGLLSAREAVASACGVAPGSIFLSASTSEAYSWAFKLLCDPGDRVLVPKPGYPLFDYLAGLDCVEAEPYRLEYLHPKGWRIDLDALARSMRDLRPKALVLIHPNNPTGSYVRDEERRFIVDLCADAGCALVVDEVFRRYELEDEAAPSFAGEGRALTFALDGFSKLLAMPQLKLGWMSVSGPSQAVSAAVARLEVISDTYLSAGAPAMNAAPRLLGVAGETVSRIASRARENLAELRRRFEGPDSPYRVLRCGGGWTAVLEVPRVASEESMALELLDRHGIYAHPGYFYDFEREAYLAISLIVPRPEFRDGAERLRRALDRMVG